MEVGVFITMAGLEPITPEQEALLKSLKEGAAALDTYTKALEANHRATQKYKALMKDQSNLFERLKSARRDLYLEEQKGLGASEEQRKTLLKIIENLQKEKDLVDALFESYKKSNEYEKLHIELNEKLVESLSKLSGLSGKTTTVFDNFFKVLGKGPDEGGNGAFKILIQSFKEAAKEVFTLEKIAGKAMGSIFAATAQYVMQVDVGVKAFERSTGLVEKYNSTLMDAQRANIEYGVSITDITRATSDLTSTFGSFSIKAIEAKANIINFTALQTALGVSSENTAKLFSYFADTLGYSDKAVMNNVRSIEAMAYSLNISANTAISDFISLLPDMIKYSDDASGIFVKLSGTAKVLGADVKALYGEMKKFDTFNGAAESVGRLNAILGGPYLNTMQMLRADEDERVKLMIQGFQATNKSWDALTKYERQALATAAGISDLGLIQKMYNADMNELDSIMIDTSQSQKENEERSRATLNITEKLNAAFASMAVFLEPIIDALQWLAGALVTITSFGNNLTGFGKTLADLVKIGIIVTVVYGVRLVKAFAWFGTAFKTLGTTAAPLGSKIGGAIKGLLTGVSEGLVMVGRNAGWIILAGVAIGLFVAAVGGGTALAIMAIAGGLFVLASAITAVRVAFSDNYDIDNQKIIANMAESLSKIPDSASSNLDRIAESIGKLGDAFDDFDFSSVTGFNKIIGDISKLANINVEMATTRTDRVSNLVRNVVDAAQGVTGGNAARGVSSGNLANPAAGGKLNPQANVILQVNEKVLGNVIVDILEKRYDLRVKGYA